MERDRDAEGVEAGQSGHLTCASRVGDVQAANSGQVLARYHDRISDRPLWQWGDGENNAIVATTAVMGTDTASDSGFV